MEKQQQTKASKYGGTLVHCQRDEYGLVEVVDHGEQRSLYFETPVQQSCVVLHEPTRLLFDYYRAMCLPLLFRPDPKKILLLGLGGGGIARFLLETLPQTEVVAVEFRESVVDVAYSHFGLPVSDRLSVWVSEASWFLSQTEEHFDIVMVDIYDAVGLSDYATQLDFFDRAIACLVEGGIFVMNLWTSDKDEFARMSEMLQRVFEDRVLYIEVDDANSVALAFPHGWPGVSMKALKREGASWQDRTQVNFLADLKRLKQWNGAGYTQR